MALVRPLSTVDSTVRVEDIALHEALAADLADVRTLPSLGLLVHRDILPECGRFRGTSQKDTILWLKKGYYMVLFILTSVYVLATVRSTIKLLLTAALLVHC